MDDDLIGRLESLYVWPQSVADHHADVLTPRQIEKLYEVGNVAEQAIARITTLTAELAEALRERTEARAEAANLRADAKQARAKVIALRPALADVLKCFDIKDGLSVRDEQAIKHGASVLFATALESGECLADSGDSPSPPPVV